MFSIISSKFLFNILRVVQQGPICVVILFPCLNHSSKFCLVRVNNHIWKALGGIYLLSCMKSTYDKPPLFMTVIQWILILFTYIFTTKASFMTMLGKDLRQFFHEDYMQDNEFYQTEKKLWSPTAYLDLIYICNKNLEEKNKFAAESKRKFCTW